MTSSWSSLPVPTAGGTHHAFADRGEGFCLFNDIAVAAAAAIAEFGLERILIIDLDVHQVGLAASLHLSLNRIDASIRIYSCLQGRG